MLSSAEQIADGPKVRRIKFVDKVDRDVFCQACDDVLPFHVI